MFHLKTLVGAITVAVAVMIEDIGEQGIILIIIRIIRAGTTLFTNSSNFSWNKICCWIPAKVKEITEKRGTSADYSDSDYY